MSWDRLDEPIESNSPSLESISINGDASNGGTIRIAIGFRTDDNNGLTNNGKCIIYDYNDSTWTQIGSELTGHSGQDFFGKSVSLNNDGTILAVSGNKYVKVYHYNNTDWVQIGTTISETNNNTDLATLNETFASVISMMKTSTSTNIRIAIGEPNYHDSSDSENVLYNVGRFSVYQYTTVSDFTLLAELHMTVLLNMSGFGNSMSISDDGNVLAIGLGGAGYNSGSPSSRGVKVYHYNSINWSL